MQRIVSLFLTAIFLSNILGAYVMFSVLDYVNRCQMSNLPEQNKSSQILRIQKTDLNNIVFYEGEKEVSYYGKMYDVKQKIKEGDTIILKCIPDETETNLLSNLDSNTQNNLDLKSSPLKKQNNLLKSILNNDYYVNNYRNPLLRSWYKVIYSTSYFSLHTFAASVHTPPPKALIS